MAIGKPLLVQERKGVAKPVLSPQTQQLSTNVAAQKMEMADYNIGMNNAMASQQVTGELVSMVNAGINAKVYAEQTKQQYNRLNLMEDWNKTDNEFKTRFAKAITPEEQEVVINDFSVSMEKRTADYRKGGGTGLPTGDSIQSQRDLSSLRNRSNNLYSKFATTMNANINTRTNAMLDTNTKALMKQVTTDENADPISIMNQIKENYAKQVQTGGLLKEQAEWNLGVNIDAMVTGRAILFAKSLAKETIGSTSKRPLAPAELKTHMEKVLGMPLTERRHKLLTDAYKETYYKELTTFNAEEGAQDKYGNQKSKELVSTFEAEWYTVYSDKIITASERQGLIEKAKVIDYWRPGFSDLKIAELDASEFGAANTTAVTSMTVGEESDEIKAILDPDKTGYYSEAHLSALGTSLTAKGHTLKTIDGVLNVYRAANLKTDKDLITTAPVAFSDVVAHNITKNTPVGLEMKKEGEVFKHAKATDVSLVGWDKALQGGRWGAAYTKTLSQLQLMANRHEGWASKDNQGLPVGERIALFKKEAQMMYQNNLNAELEKFNAEKAKKLAEKEAAARLKTGGLTKVRGAGEVGKDTGIPQGIKPSVISSPETLDMTILNSNLLSGDHAKVISEGLPTAIREYFKGQDIKLGYTGDLNTRKKGIQDLATMSENIENSYLGIFAKGVNEIVSGAVGQMKEDAEAVMNYAMEGLANFTAQKLNAGQKPPTGDTSYNIYTGEKPEGEGEEGEPQVAGGGIGTGKGLWEPIDYTQALSDVASSIRYFDAENQPTDVIPQEVWNRLPKHSLSAGDTLSDLANQYNISVEELQRLNPQTVGREAALQIGEQIALPSMQQPQQKVEDMDFGKKSTVPVLDEEYLRQTESGESFPKREEDANLEQYESFLKTREATRTEAVADVGSGVDPDGAGYGHILNEKEKEWWKSAPIKQREAQADKWFKEDMGKARSAAQKQMKPLGDRADSDTLESTLTSINFQLGTEWRTKFPKAWKGIAAGQNKGTTPMFKDKTGWDQAIYHLMHANEKSNEPSKWLMQTPRRVMDAVLAIHAISEAGNKEDIIAHIDNILEGLE